MYFFNIWKRNKQKNCARFFKICKYTFLIFEIGCKPKIVIGFVNILFLIFEKGNKQKIASGFFRIWKYTFLIFEKGYKQKIFVRFFFKIFKYTFLIFEKANKQKLGQVFLRFVNILFKYLKKENKQKNLRQFF